MTDIITLHDGHVMQVHSASSCFGPNCCIHNPSDHPMRDAPLDWWPGVGMMRRCEHGFTHPDPDDLNVKVFTHGLIAGLALVEAICSTHLMSENCDGCCR